MKNNFYLLIYLLLGTHLLCNAQTMSIHFKASSLPKKEVSFYGYSGLRDTLFSKSITDISGMCTLEYPANYIGIGLIKIDESINSPVILNNESFSINWPADQAIRESAFDGSPENTNFVKGFQLQDESLSKLLALDKLAIVYEEGEFKKAMTDEIKRMELKPEAFLKELKSNYYAKYYLNLRKMLIDMVRVNSLEKLLPVVSNFQKLDFKDPHLVHSGLY